MEQDTTNTSQTIKELPPIQKDDNSQIRLAIKTYKGSTYIDIRTYFLEKEQGKGWLPTQKGITIPVDDTFDMLEDLTAGLEELYQFLVRQEETEGKKEDGNTGETG